MKRRWWQGLTTTPGEEDHRTAESLARLETLLDRLDSQLDRLDAPCDERESP